MILTGISDIWKDKPADGEAGGHRRIAVGEEASVGGFRHSVGRLSLVETWKISFLNILFAGKLYFF